MSVAQSKGGKLTLTLTRARGLKNMETFGKQDPYAKLDVQGQKMKSKVHKKGGSDPTWNETWTFDLTSTPVNFDVELWDQDTLSDDFIGKASIPFSQLLAAPGAEVFFPVVLKNETSPKGNPTIGGIVMLKASAGSGSSFTKVKAPTIEKIILIIKKYFFVILSNS